MITITMINHAAIKNETSGGGTPPPNITYNAAAYTTEATTELLREQSMTATYKPATALTDSHSMTRAASQAPWRFTLAEIGPILPGSVILEIDGDTWWDDGDGRLLRNYNTSTGTGTAQGTIDYESTEVTIDHYDGRPTSATVQVIGCITGEDWSILKKADFRTAAAPLRPNGFTVRGDDFDTGTQYTGQADNQGDVSGTGVTGNVDLQKGLASLTFSQPVAAASVFYNAVSYKNIPLDPSILGLDPVRLPGDGRVPIIRDADILVLTHTAKDAITTPAAGDTLNAGRDRLHDIWIEDDNSTRLAPEQYTTDKEAGTLTLADPLSLVDGDGNALVGQLHLTHRVDEMALCSEARIDGALQLAQPLYHDLPANETWVASAVYLGSLAARVVNWESYSSDPGGYDSTGDNSNAQYNLVAYPIAIDNGGSVPDRWKIRFTSSTAFELFSEARGLVATGSTATDFSPTNPQTGTPYFTIRADGWGSGWQVNNTVRFDTQAAAAPLWLIRTVLPGLATVDNDQLRIELRGDHN